jgi:minor extracellular serine protease Vpr
MKRIVAMTALVCLPIFSHGATAQSLEPLEPLEPTPAPAAVTAEDGVSAWFVELQNPPLADGGDPALLAAEKKAFRDAAQKAGIQLKERYSYEQLWNGLSVQVRSESVSKLSRLTGVKNLYPVVTVAMPEVEPANAPELSTALAMTQADIAQSGLGLTGHGIRVAVMDTGVDYDHPDLGGCFGPGCRVEVGYDFVGNAYNNDNTSPSYNPVPTPDPLPDDCGGHGTHVAGIVGANGGVRGVAPGVTFGAYKVFGCEGSTDADIMVAAMERIAIDGADVVNISIGAAFQWPQYPSAQAADRLVQKGIVVVTSAGNSGSAGTYAVGAPGTGRKVITVASYNNTHVKNPAFQVSPDGKMFAYNSANGSPTTPLSGTGPLAATGTPTSVDDGCSPLPAGSMSGKIVLIRRGTCGFYDKSLNAQNAGAIGVVLYNNQAGTFVPNVVGAVAIDIPVVAVTAVDGALIHNRIVAGPTALTWTAQTLATPIAGGNLIAGSSSYGMVPDLSLKPDIGAPGSQIRSTIPVEYGSYGNLSGTSMSSPHVAGAVALMLEAHPNTPPAAVLALLQNTADPRPWAGNPTLGILDNVHRQGAGMLRIADAVRAAAKVEPSKLALGESEAGPATRTLTVQNNGPAAVTYQLSHTPALATGGSTFVPSFFAGFATAAWSVPTLTVPAGGTATVDVTITAPSSLANRSLYGGYLTLTPEGGGQVVRVPYAGFKGDYQSIPVLVPTANGFPWLAKLNAGSYENRPTGATYTMQGTDVPYFLVHFDHQVRELRLEVFDAVSGKSWHRALSQDYVGRNSGAATWFTLSWDGITTGGGKTYTVPNGQYVMRLTVRKALGDAANPAHSETWTSPVITIARP